MFAVAFMPLGKYAGGYHESTPLRCYILTIGVITAALSAMKYIKIDIFVCLLLLVLSSIIILLLSPVESENKPLDSIEKMVYRKKAIVIWGVELVCIMILQIIGMQNLSFGIVYAQVATGLSMIFVAKEGRHNSKFMKEGKRNEKKSCSFIVSWYFIST